MNGEQDKILHMLEEGTISTEEAQTLLDAIEDSRDNDNNTFWSREVEGYIPSRDYWRRPFGIFLISATFWGSLVIRTRKTTGFFSLFRKALLFPLAFGSALGAGIIYLSKDSPWLHLRIRSAEEEKLSLSLPFPLNILRGGLQFISSQIEDEEAGEKIDAATEFLEAVEMADYQNPVSIDIEEEGNNIQIFLG